MNATAKTYDRYLIEDEFFFDENTFPKGSSLRHDHELFDDNEHRPHDIISVKRVELSRGEDWEITKNGKPSLILKGVRFTVREKEFLRTSDGMLFVIAGFKDGWKSVSEYKRRLKKRLSA